MKKALLIAALSLAAAPAMASKARLSSLNAPAAVSDIQDVFTNPAKATQHGDWLTFEMGQTASSNAIASGTHAEGGFSRSMNDARWGFYMGHQYSQVTEQRANVTYEATAIAPDNTINLFYGSKAGEMAWGAGLGYSKTDKKTTAVKQDALAISGGVATSMWDAALTVHAMNNYKDESATAATTRDFKGKMAWDLSGTYYMDDLAFSAGVNQNAAKVENGTGAEVHNFEWMGWNVGAEKSVKMEGALFFYGAKYTMKTNKDKVPGTDSKLEESTMPVYAGIEADANSWLVLRGSVSQNFLLGTSQTTSATTTGAAADKNTIANNTTVNAGAGLKFGKLSIDGNLAAQTGGAAQNTAAVDGTNLLYNGSLTYMF